MKNNRDQKIMKVDLTQHEVTSMKPRYLVLSLVIVILLTVVLYNSLSIDFAHSGSKLFKEDLILLKEFPKSYSTSNTTINDSENIISKAWHESPNELFSPLVQNIYPYKSSIESTINFHIKKFQHLISSKWPNFYSPQNLYPSNSYENPAIGSSFIVCDMDTPENCQRWYALYTKDNLIFEVILYDINEGISSNQFYNLLDKFVAN